MQSLKKVLPGASFFVLPKHILNAEDNSRKNGQVHGLALQLLPIHRHGLEPFFLSKCL